MNTKGIYYHIQKDDYCKPQWEVGQNYYIDPNSENYFQKLLLSSFREYRRSMNGNEYGLIGYDHEVFPEDICDIEALKSFKYDLVTSLSQYLKWIEETLFEKVRLEIDPRLPSRKSCIWLCTYDRIEDWLERLIDKKSIYKQPGYRILELAVDGCCHEADATFLNADTFTIEDFETAAKRYWNGERQFSNEVEILFYGNLSVIKEFRSFEEIVL